MLACLQYQSDTGMMPDWTVEDPSRYPQCIVRLQFWGCEAWSMAAAARADLGHCWPYYQDMEVTYCPDWETDPELIQAGVVWPGTDRFLSYAFNARVKAYFPTLDTDWYMPGVEDHALDPEQFAEPAATLYFMDSRSGYPGSYINPPFWAFTFTHWPDPPYPGDSGGCETFYPSRRHFGNFNAAFMDGHAATCEHDEYYDVGPDSKSIRYWGIYAN